MTEEPSHAAVSVDTLAHQLPGLRFVVGGLALTLGIAALHYGKPLLAPLLLAALLAFMLAPAVSLLRRCRFPHVAAVTLVVAGAVALCGTLALIMGQQVVALSHDLPSYQDTVRDKLRALRPTALHGPWQDGLRMLGVVEGELDATRRALAPKATAVQRVQMEAVPPTPLQAMAGLAVPLMLPLAQTGLVLVLLFFMLLQRHEIRDRVLRLMGQDLARSAETLTEAGRRVSRYLMAQLLVNSCYAVPLGMGLWAIGVPGAWLWGLFGGVMRFVPYLGPVVASFCPLLIAFAVDPGWQMVLQTLALILVLELALNNLIEPLAYSQSTGVSSLAVLLSAGFWSLVWGPVGLAIATPLTVCLVVLGRQLGPLRLLDPLLGAEPVFDAPMRLHQRLASGDLEEALEQAEEVHTAEGLLSFYDDTALGALRHLVDPNNTPPSAAQRQRVVASMTRLLTALQREGPERTETGPMVLCIGARNEVDSLSAQMLAHALQVQGLNGQAMPASALSADRIGELPLDGVSVVCLCSFNPAPLVHTRFVLRRLRRYQPDMPMLLAAWAEDADLTDNKALEQLGGVHLVTTLHAACEQVAESVSSYPEARSEPAVAEWAEA